jgi:hypothetical protein
MQSALAHVLFGLLRYRFDKWRLKFAPVDAKMENSRTLKHQLLVRPKSLKRKEATSDFRAGNFFIQKIEYSVAVLFMNIEGHGFRGIERKETSSVHSRTSAGNISWDRSSQPRTGKGCVNKAALKNATSDDQIVAPSKGDLFP